MQIAVHILDHNADFTMFAAKFLVDGDPAFIARQAGEHEPLETTPVGEYGPEIIEQVRQQVEVSGVHCPYFGSRLPMPLDLFVQREHASAVMRDELATLLQTYWIFESDGVLDFFAADALPVPPDHTGHLLNQQPFVQACEIFERAAYIAAAQSDLGPDPTP